MEKKNEDYLHLYLGCEVMVMDEDGQTFRDRLEQVFYAKNGDREFGIYEWGLLPIKDYREIKLLLRPLSSMTVKEICTIFNEAFAPSFATDNIKAVSGSLFGLHKFISEYGDFDSIQKLLKLGFDLFGLIDAGLAIDSTTLKPIEQ